MNHSGFKGLKVASVVGGRIQGDAWGFHWSKKRPAGVGYAGLWGLPNRGLYLRSRGSHRKVFKNICVGREGGASPDQTCIVGTLPCGKGRDWKGAREQVGSPVRRLLQWLRR